MKLSRYNLIIWDERKKKHILFNTLYGECFLADSSILQCIKENDVSLLKPEVLELFKEKKILIEDNIDELRYIEYFHNRSKYDNRHLNFTVLLTWACNLRCTYCYEGGGEVRNKTLNFVECDSIITFIKQQIDLVRPEFLSLMLFGGEPLLNMEGGVRILEAIDSYCTEKKVQFTTSIITNGVLMDDRNIEILKKYHCDYVQITLDGVRHIHDERRVSKDGTSSFDKVIEALKRISATKDFVKPVIRINTDKQNVEEIEELLSFLKAEELNTCRVDFGIVHSGTEACSNYSDSCYCDEELGDLLDSLWNLAAKYGFSIKTSPRRNFMFCGLNKENSYTIAPNLDVYKCWEHVGEEKHRIGHLEQDGTMKEELYTLADWMSINPTNVEECRECIYLPSCGGGCAVRAYNSKGTYHAPGCFKVKGVVEKELLASLREQKFI